MRRRPTVVRTDRSRRVFVNEARASGPGLRRSSQLPTVAQTAKTYMKVASVGPIPSPHALGVPNA